MNQKPSFKLEITNGPYAGKSFHIVKDKVVVGRDKDCDIPFTENKKLSRRHAELRKKDNNIFIEDLGSSNGTKVNGRRIDTIRLKDGDHVQLADCEFIFHKSEGNEVNKGDDSSNSQERDHFISELPRYIIVVAGLLIILMVGSLVHRQTKRTPAYAISQIKSALETHDYYTFTKYVDVDSCLNYAVDDVAKAAPIKQSDGEEQLDISSLKVLLKGEIIRYVDQSPDKNESKGGVDNHVIRNKKVRNGVEKFKKKMDALEILKPSKTTIEGKSATIEIQLSDQKNKKSFTIELRLRWAGDHWQVAQIQNIGSIYGEFK